MKFNTKTRYGLRTILELALNENSDEGVFQKEIAKNQDVSVKYLDHIIASLKSAGLVVNVGGKKSGYKLNRPAKDISIYDVYKAFEGDMSIIDCLYPEGECLRKESCVLKGFWCDLNSSIITKMKSRNMEELANNHDGSIDVGKIA
jgi:Rrf2 family protein